MKSAFKSVSTADSIISRSYLKAKRGKSLAWHEWGHVQPIMSAIWQKKPFGRFHWKTLKGCIEAHQKRSRFSPNCPGFESLWCQRAIDGHFTTWTCTALDLYWAKATSLVEHDLSRTSQKLAEEVGSCWKELSNHSIKVSANLSLKKSPWEFFWTEGTGRGKKFWFWTKDKLGVHLLGNFCHSLSLFLSPSHLHTQPRKHTHAHAHVHSHCSSPTFAHVSFSFSLTL